ncbi:MAG: CDP-alcohol phosphatidyltransferase family protein [Anaerolineae bacterium]|nr:CDP-alcohol phosphatidyltransferase family protein [Anaerolineae bacterium]
MPDKMTSRADLQSRARTLLNPAGRVLHRLGVHPDVLTLCGLLVVAVAAVVIGLGQMQAGAVVLLLGLPLDALDGAVARARPQKSRFGAVLDSVLDRYADGFIFMGLSYYFAQHDRFEMLLLAQVALIGSLLVSYVRARGDGVECAATVGWFTRVERSVVILVALLVPPLLDVGLLVLAVGTNVTALQRLWFIRKDLHNRGE